MYRSGSVDPAYNLALEQFLFETKDPGEIRVFLWQNASTVVIGRYQNIFEEVNLDFAKEHGITVVRRVSGGGAVYHDLGNLNYTFLVDFNTEDLKYCRDILEKALGNLGIICEYQGRNDLSVRGYKISGTAEHIERNKRIYHGTLLINTDLNILRQVLTRNNKIARSVSTKSVPMRVKNISELIGREISIDMIEQAIQTEFGAEMIKKETGIRESRIREIMGERYGNERWNYGFPAEYSCTSFHRFPTGGIRLSACVNNGIIRSVKVSGDFIAIGDIQKMEKIFLGHRLDENIMPVLKERNADRYIRGITCEDWQVLYRGLGEHPSERLQ